MYREDEGGCKVETIVDVFWVGQGVCAIDARRDPSDEEGDEEKEGNASIEEGFGVLLAQCDGSRDAR